MLLHSLARLFRRPQPARTRPDRKANRPRLSVERLEERAVPALGDLNITSVTAPMDHDGSATNMCVAIYQGEASNLAVGFWYNVSAANPLANPTQDVYGYMDVVD